MSNSLKIDTDNIIQYAGLIKLVEIWPNTGQIPGVPKNPRYLLEKGEQDLMNSIKDDPQLLQLNPLILFPYADAYVVLAGNMRRKICVDLGFKEVQCIVINKNTPVETLKKFIMIDNIAYGKNDWDLIANEWELEDLEYWGLEIPHIDMPDEEITMDKEDNGNENLSIKVLFKGNYEDYDKIKEGIEKLVSKYNHVEVK